MHRSVPLPSAQRADRVSAGVRRALRVGAGVVATSVAGIIPLASADTFPSVLPLRTLYKGDGSEGIVLRGVIDNQFDANSVSTAGDINGDGIDDVVLGGETGASYVVFGAAAFPPTFNLASLWPPNGDGSAGFILELNREDASLPAVSQAGDVNGDGLDDLIIGFKYAFFARGMSFVVFGRNGSSFPPMFRLRSLLPDGGGDGSDGFALGGAYCAHAGASVSSAGDVNGDGIDDLIIGAPNYGSPCFYGTAIGEGYIVFGRNTQRDGNFPAAFDLTSLKPANGGDGSAGVYLLSVEINDVGGDAVSGGGDVNGDGVDDVLFGAWNTENNGETFVVFGRDVTQAGSFPAEIDLSELLPQNGGDGSNGFVLSSQGISDQTGSSVSLTSDINADGIDDIVIGGEGAASAYVLFGRDTAQQGNFPAELSLRRLLPPVGDGSTGFVMTGAYFLLGLAVSGAGDLNGDGIGDLIAGSKYTPLGRSTVGSASVLFGRDTAQVGDFPATVPVRLLAPPVGDGSNGFIMAGVRNDDLAGRAVRTAGDFNADGIDDVIVASRRDAYVVYGRDYDPERR